MLLFQFWIFQHWGMDIPQYDTCDLSICLYPNWLFQGWFENEVSLLVYECYFQCKELSILLAKVQIKFDCWIGVNKFLLVVRVHRGLALLWATHAKGWGQSVILGTWTPGLLIFDSVIRLQEIGRCLCGVILAHISTSQHWPGCWRKENVSTAMKGFDINNSLSHLTNLFAPMAEKREQRKNEWHCAVSHKMEPGFPMPYCQCLTSKNTCAKPGDVVS